MFPQLRKIYGRRYTGLEGLNCQHLFNHRKRKGIPDWGGGDGLSKGVEVGIRRKIWRTVQLEHRVQERVEIRTET